MPVLVIRSEGRQSTITLTLVDAPTPPVPSEWCVAVEIYSLEVTGRNADVYFLREDATAFLLQLRALEASRTGTATLHSIGEGSEGQEFSFSLSASDAWAPLTAKVEIAKLRWNGRFHTENRCRITCAVDQGDLLQILRDADALFEARDGK